MLSLDSVKQQEFQDTKRALFQGFHSLGGKKIGKRAVSYDMPYLIVVKKKKRLPGKMSITSDMQMTPPLRQKVKRN